MWHFDLGNLPTGLTGFQLPGKTRVMINDAWNADGANIGGEWGHPGEGDVVKSGTEVDVRTKLPESLHVKVIGWDTWKPEDKFIFRKSFEFTYRDQNWRENTTGTTGPHCDQTEETQAKDNNIIFKYAWICYWDC